MAQEETICQYCEHPNEVECADCHEWFQEEEGKFIERGEDSWFLCNHCRLIRKSQAVIRGYKEGRYI